MINRYEARIVHVVAVLRVAHKDVVVVGEVIENNIVQIQVESSKLANQEQPQCIRCVDNFVRTFLQFRRCEETLFLIIMQN